MDNSKGRVMQSEKSSVGNSVESRHDSKTTQVEVSVAAQQVSDAKAATQHEHKLGVRQALRLYAKATFFSWCISLAIVMVGYGTYLISNLFGQQTFARKYGELTGEIKDGVPQYEISASWQSALVAGSAIAQIIGLFFGGYMSDKIGYRWMMITAQIACAALNCLTFFAKDIQMLLAGYILSGLPWGVFQSLTTTYAAEVCPVSLRPILTTYVNLCFVLGQLLAACVLKGMVSNESEWAYRIPFAIQWVWPAIVGVVTFLAPESPWWLVRHNKIDEARDALVRLTNIKADPTFNVNETLAMIIKTNELESKQLTGTSFADCFKGINLRRTEITCLTSLVQQTSGSPLIGWGVYFMLQAGLSEQDAFSIGIGICAMGLVSAIGSWGLIPHFGRRTLYLAGQIILLAVLVTIGSLGVPAESVSTSWATGALILVLTFVYGLTIGPVCYSLIAELPSTRLRLKSITLSRNLYNVFGIIIGIIQPRFINPTALNWRGKTAFFWAGLNILGLTWTYFRLPEPKGLTYAELDVRFENKISARNFRKVEDVDPWASETSSMRTVTNVDDNFAVAETANATPRTSGEHK